MLEALAEAEVDKDRKYQRHAGHSEAPVIGSGEHIDVMAGELGKITGCTLSGSQSLETAERIRSHRGSAGQVLVG